jgi:hypothetical protein
MEQATEMDFNFLIIESVFIRVLLKHWGCVLLRQFAGKSTRVPDEALIFP